MRWLACTVLAVGCSRGPAPDRSGPAEPPRPTPAAPEGARPLGHDTRPAPGGLDAGEAPGASAPIDAALPPVRVVDAPMAWSERRAELTLAYRRTHSDAEATDLTIEPRVIVLHYTGGGSARGTRTYFDQEQVEASRAQLRRAGAVNVSAHYVVDRDGTIYQLQPVTRFARHCIGLNHVAIGIENVGDERRYPLTEAQIAANAALVRHLAASHAITHLLGHHEVMRFRDHAYYRERDPAYRNSKPDPGARFMTAVRAAVAELGLGGLD